MSKKRRHKKKSCRGMALLSVLFVVMAVVVISMGYIIQADRALACGQNLCLRNQSDYLAWSGLEHARALIQSDPNDVPDPNAAWPMVCSSPDAQPNLYYELTIDAPSVAGSIYTYPVNCEAYYQTGTEKQARSYLNAVISYDFSDGRTTFKSINRQ